MEEMASKVVVDSSSSATDMMKLQHLEIANDPISLQKRDG